jgi:hypothetical protein
MMSPTIRFIATVIATSTALALASCATLKVSSHVERGAEFTHYRTWDWVSDAAEPTGDPRLDSNPFFQDDVRRAVEHELTRKGYVRSTLAGPADLLVHYHANFNKTFEMSGGARAGSCHGDDCQPEAYAYEQGTLVIDVVDARTEKVVWRGWSRDNMDGVIDSQGLMGRQIDRAVAAMFGAFPAI